MSSPVPITIVAAAKTVVVKDFLNYKSEYIQEFFNECFIGIKCPAKNSWEKAVLYMYSQIMGGILSENILYDDMYFAFLDFYMDTREYYNGVLKDAVDDFFIRVTEMRDKSGIAVEVQPVKVCYSSIPLASEVPDPSGLFA